MKYIFWLYHQQNSSHLKTKVCTTFYWLVGFDECPKSERSRKFKQNKFDPDIKSSVCLLFPEVSVWTWRPSPRMRWSRTRAWRPTSVSLSRNLLSSDVQCHHQPQKILPAHKTWYQAITINPVNKLNPQNQNLFGGFLSIPPTIFLIFCY